MPPPNVDNNNCEHQDLFDSTVREGETPAHISVNCDQKPSVSIKCDWTTEVIKDVKVDIVSIKT